MDYKDRYNRLLDAIKELQKENPSDEGIQNWINDNVPELAESEDERIRKAIHIYLDWLDGRKDYAPKGEYSIRDMIAWLEKQCQVKESLIPQHENKTCASEDDERIRKALIRFHKSSIDIDGIKGEDIIAWLKKQGEQKSDDNVETKFKAGDWVVFANGNVGHITSAGTHGYTFDDGDYLLHDNCDKQAHLWSITDAKDGDVLVSELSGTIILFKGIEDNNVQFYCDYDFSEFDVPGDKFAVNNSGQHYGSVEDSEDFHPATKSQRDILMKAMADAGYTFVFDNKKLKRKEKK